MATAKKEPQSEMWESNPERYVKCSQPFASDAAATAASEAFLADVSAAREKHSICDVELIIKDSFTAGDDTSAFITSAHFGNPLERESMLAYAFGRAQRSRQQLIGKLLAGGGTKDAD